MAQLLKALNLYQNSLRIGSFYKGKTIDQKLRVYNPNPAYAFRNGDGKLGPRIVADAGGPMADAELAEAGKLYLVTIGQRFVNQAFEGKRPRIAPLYGWTGSE